jgi:hypothetical protein
LKGRKINEKRLSQAVVLVQNSDFHCGKLERLIIFYLRKKDRFISRKNILLKEIVNALSLSQYSRDECLDAIRRLEKRNILMLTPN